jgi:hypothetical protein
MERDKKLTAATQRARSYSNRSEAAGKTNGNPGISMIIGKQIYVFSLSWRPLAFSAVVFPFVP